MPYNYRGKKQQTGTRTEANKSRAAARLLYVQMREELNQRATTTVVPTETRWYRSVMSAFSMRMQP